MGRTHRHDQRERPARAIRSWPFALGACALATTTGVLLAGLPSESNPFVLGPKQKAAVPVLVALEPRSDAPVPVEPPSIQAIVADGARHAASQAADAVP